MYRPRETYRPYLPSTDPLEKVTLCQVPSVWAEQKLWDENGGTLISKTTALHSMKNMMGTTHNHCAAVPIKKDMFGFLFFELCGVPIGYGMGFAPCLHLCLAVTKNSEVSPWRQHLLIK